MPGRQAASSDLPAPGRAAHQQIVAAGGGDLERALGHLLPFYLAEVGPASRRLDLGRGRRCDQRGALQMGEKREQVGRGDRRRAARPRLASLPCAAGQIRPLSSDEA